MSEGIKETKEVLVGSIVIGKLVASELKDGFQLNDIVDVFSAIMADEAKKAKLVAAVADVGKVAAEIKDISFPEGFELLSAALAELQA